MSIKKMILVGIGVCLVRSTIKDILDTIRLKAYYGSPVPRPVPPGFRMDNSTNYRTSYSERSNPTIYRDSSKSELRMPKTDEAIARAINGRFNDPPKDFYTYRDPSTHSSKNTSYKAYGTDLNDIPVSVTENKDSAQETPVETEEGDS